MLLRNF